MDPKNLDAEFDSAAGLDAEFDAAPSTIPGPGADNTPPAPQRPGPMQRMGESVMAAAQRPEFGQAGRAFGEGLTFNFGSELAGLGQNAMARMANAAPKGSLEWMGVDNRYPHDPEQFGKDTQREHEAQLAQDREASPYLTGAARGVGGAVSGVALTPLMPFAGAAGAGNLTGTLAGGHAAARAALGSTVLGGMALGGLDGAGAAGEGARAQGASDGGVFGAATAMGGHYLAPLFGRLSAAARAAPERLREIAREFAARATGMSPDDMLVLGEDGIQALGAALERNNLAGFTTTLEKLVARAGGLRKDAGASMGSVVDFADGLSRDMAGDAARMQSVQAGAPSPRDARLDSLMAGRDAAQQARAAFRQANTSNLWNGPEEQAAVDLAIRQASAPARTPGMSTTVQSDWGVAPQQMGAASPAPYRRPRSYSELNAPPAPPVGTGGPNIPPGIEDYQPGHLPGRNPVHGEAHGGQGAPGGPPNVNGLGIPLPGVLPERPMQYGFDTGAAADQMNADFISRYGSAPAVMDPALQVGQREAERLRGMTGVPSKVEVGQYGYGARAQPVTFRQAQSRVADLGRATNWTPDPSTPEEALQLARNSLAGSVERQLGQLDARAGSGLVPEYRAAKEQFGHMADAHTFGTNTLNARLKATQTVDPTALGATQRAYHKFVGSPLSQSAAATRLAANGPVSPAANTTAFISEMLSTNPAAYGIFAGPLQKALQAGGETALGQEFKLLYDSMPGFRMMIRGHEEEQEK